MTKLLCSPMLPQPQDKGTVSNPHWIALAKPLHCCRPDSSRTQLKGGTAKLNASSTIAWHLQERSAGAVTASCRALALLSE